MFFAKAQLTNKAFTDAGKGLIRQSLTALVIYVLPASPVIEENQTAFRHHARPRIC